MNNFFIYEIVSNLHLKVYYFSARDLPCILDQPMIYEPPYLIIWHFMAYVKTNPTTPHIPTKIHQAGCIGLQKNIHPKNSRYLLYILGSSVKTDRKEEIASGDYVSHGKSCPRTWKMHLVWATNCEPRPPTGRSARSIENVIPFACIDLINFIISWLNSA